MSTWRRVESPLSVDGARTPADASGVRPHDRVAAVVTAVTIRRLSSEHVMSFTPPCFYVDLFLPLFVPLNLTRSGPFSGPSRDERFLRKHKAPRHRCRLVEQPLPRATCCMCLVCGLCFVAAVVFPSQTRRTVSRTTSQSQPLGHARGRS
jgi:hypothetical protein